MLYSRGKLLCGSAHIHREDLEMDKKILRKSLWLMGFAMAGIGIFDGGTLQAQVVDPGCFSGSCGGSRGIPQCPEGF